MTITIIGSMAFTDQMLEFKAKLEKLNHTVYVSDFATEYAGKSQEQIQQMTIKDKMHKNGLIECCDKIEKSDAVFVLNLEKRGVKNYVGGNTLIEMGYAFILGKKIFMLNPIPEIDLYKSEIEAMFPVILNGDLSLVKLN